MAKRYYTGDYEGMDERRRQEEADGKMISGAGAPAGLPQNVIMKTFPGRGAGAPEGYGDTKESIDMQISADMSAKNKQMKYKE